jgi:hypothetical protein
MTPESLYKTTVANFAVTIQKIFGILPYAVKYERDDLSYPKITDILHTIKSAISARSFLIMSPATLHALYLSRIECTLRVLPENAAERKELKEIKAMFAEIFTIFKQHGKCTIDEIDQTLSLGTEFNYASHSYKHLDQKFPKLLDTVMDFYKVLSYVKLPYDTQYSVLDIVLGKARKPLPTEWPFILENIANTIYEKLLANTNLDKHDLIQALLGKIDLEY